MCLFVTMEHKPHLFTLLSVSDRQTGNREVIPFLMLSVQQSLCDKPWKFQITKTSLCQAYLFSEVRPPEIWGTCYKFYLLTIFLNACHDRMDSAAEKIAYI